MSMGVIGIGNCGRPGCGRSFGRFFEAVAGVSFPGIIEYIRVTADVIKLNKSV